MSQTAERKLDVDRPAPKYGFEESWLDRTPRWLALLLLGVAGILFWYGLTLLEVVSPILFPGPVETFEEIYLSARGILSGDYVFEALLITTQEVLLGFIGAAALGFLFGVIVGETKVGQKAVMPYLVGFNAAPKVAFAPVFVAWLGFGINAKVVMALFIAFFPVIVDTAAGLSSANRDAVMLFRSLGASRWQTLTKLKLPNALPYIFAGLKTAAVFSVVGAVVGEYLGGGKGLGELVRLSAQGLRLDRVFALIFYLSLLGLALFGFVNWLERRLLFWHKSDPLEITSA